VHFNVTAHPTAEWTAQQLREAFPFEQIPRYLLRDRDRIFGDEFTRAVKAMGITEVLSAPLSPWQRAYVERVIGTLRRECLDHVIVLNEASLYRHVKSFLEYYHESRTHLSLAKDPAGTAARAPAAANGCRICIGSVSGSLELPRFVLRAGELFWMGVRGSSSAHLDILHIRESHEKGRDRRSVTPSRGVWRARSRRRFSIPSGVAVINLKKTDRYAAKNCDLLHEVAGAGNQLTVRIVRHSQRKRGATDRPNLRSNSASPRPCRVKVC